MKTKTSTAFIIRVDRKIAGRKIPFDKIYLFRKQDQQRLPSIFNSAMVFPLTKRFVAQIKNVLKDYKEGYKMFPHLRGCEDSLQRRIEHDNFVENWNDFVALVPVLFTREGNATVEKKKKGHKKEATFPAYLVACGASAVLRRALSARAYFISEGKIVRPICLMCPQHQRFLQGQCHLGEKDCYRYMARAKPADMVRGVRLYRELTSNIQEPVLDF